ncbi:MAG: hypothetical protein WD397_01765 [Wenzhouxiangellaceae bacterium]
MVMLAIVGLISVAPLQAQSSSDVQVKVLVFEDVATMTIETEAGSFIGRGRLESGDFGSVALTPLSGSAEILVDTSGSGSPEATTTDDGSGPEPVETSGSGIIGDAALLVETSGSGAPLSTTYSAEILVEDDGFSVIVYEHDSDGTQEVAIGHLDRD